MSWQEISTHPAAVALALIGLAALVRTVFIRLRWRPYTVSALVTAGIAMQEAWEAVPEHEGPECDVAWDKARSAERAFFRMVRKTGNHPSYTNAMIELSHRYPGRSWGQTLSVALSRVVE